MNKIIWNTKKEKKPIFNEIGYGEYFVYRDCLFQKMEAVFCVEQINNEIDCDHDLYCSSDIQSTKYNCYNHSINTWDSLPETATVKMVEVEITVNEVE